MAESSIVEYFSGHEGYKCGYCKSENSSYSYGMWVHTLTPLDYQNLIDRGWRRSGKYCYKPTMNRTCCPQYTIRCEAKRFTLSRSQKKVLKKVHKFLTYGEQERSVSSQPSESGEQVMDVSEVPEQALKDMKKVTEIKKLDIESMNIEPTSQENTENVSQQDKDTCISEPLVMPSSSDSSQINTTSPTKSQPNKPCRKAKEIRRERKLQKLLSKGISAEEAVSSIQKKNSEPKTIESFLTEPFPVEPAYKLELRLVPSSLGNPLFSQTFEESYSVYKKYQMAIHKDPPEKCSENQYVRFLVKNPFQHCLDGVSSSETSVYGSFHQQYWLNDKLIAVGVIDVLPYCVSSVYFYYDPDYSFLSLGTYAALREIALTRELNKTYPDLQYYYMGFYIHSCVKMRYKGQYHPSYLLCPETYIFQPIEKCKPKLDIAKYQRLEEDLTKEDCDGIVNLQDILILYNHKKMTYRSYRKVNKQANDEELVREYAGFVGKKCYRRMMLYRSS